MKNMTAKDVLDAFQAEDLVAEKVMEKLEELGGVLPFTDKASPELIREQMDMSKNEFKRAVGNLLKAGKVEITQTEIRKK